MLLEHDGADHDADQKAGDDRRRFAMLVRPRAQRVIGDLQFDIDRHMEYNC